MSDEVYYNNLLGLLKIGRWSLSVEEASVIVELYKETAKRLQANNVKKDSPDKEKEGQ